MKLFLLMLPLLVALVTQVSAHEIEIAGPQNTSELLRAWTFEPGVIIPIVASAVLYSLGVFRLRRASPKSVRKSNIVYFALGWAALVLGLITILVEKIPKPRLQLKSP